MTSETGVSEQGGSRAAGPLLDPHEAMRRAVQGASSSLPAKTHDLRSLTDCWLRCVAIYGPHDLGKGSVYALDLVDADGRIYTTWCGSKQVIDQLGVPGLAEYAADPANVFSVWFNFTARFDSKGGDTGYYTMRTHFAAESSPDRPQLIAWTPPQFDDA